MNTVNLIDNTTNPMIEAMKALHSKLDPVLGEMFKQFPNLTPVPEISFETVSNGNGSTKLVATIKSIGFKTREEL